jgi:3-isopropylmalate/(R)-2-methylmalate dehydratase small subunit
MTDLIRITRVAGRPIPLRGNDIDTDQIIPARFLKVVTFEGLGAHVFCDVRFDAQGHSQGHVMDDPRYEAKGSRVAIVNKNFGCGSSREHAPQALLRWGIKAIVGESFADIFFGNCVALGIPCVTGSERAVVALLASVEDDPAHELVVDVAAESVAYRGMVYRVALPAGARTQFLEGTWDATRILVQAEEQVRQTAARLPYVKKFAT